MTPLPTLDASALGAGPASHAAFLRDIEAACRSNGFFFLKNHGIPPALCNDVLITAQDFFAGPAAEKERLHIRHSTNFRGFSQMKNSRDWREQLHFGWEWPEGDWAEGRPEYYRLAGANPWPGAAFAGILIRYMEAVQALGNRLLAALGACLGLPEDYFDNLSAEPPYLLLKQICYYAQPADAPRSGVAPHCDWSWLTILLQDETGGLEILSAEGDWLPVPPQKDTLSVNAGELLEILSRGYFRATPHRVVNPSAANRISVPVFINPPLDARVEPLVQAPMPVGVVPAETEHVHRVVPRAGAGDAFVFGESEWRRKGLGRWCYDEKCLKE